MGWLKSRIGRALRLSTITLTSDAQHRSNHRVRVRQNCHEIAVQLRSCRNHVGGFARLR